MSDIDRTKLDRKCPRCRAHRYHFATRRFVGKAGKILDGYRLVEINCAECGHTWKGRHKRDEWE